LDPAVPTTELSAGLTISFLIKNCFDWNICCEAPVSQTASLIESTEFASAHQVINAHIFFLTVVLLALAFSVVSAFSTGGFVAVPTLVLLALAAALPLILSKKAFLAALFSSLAKHFAGS
jgi:hypothetical protein